MTQNIWVVDAFATKPFSGNPAAVVILAAYPEDGMLQQIAMEMNLSETAFLVQNALYDYELCWFTPTMEVSLCGHGTLAATHVLLKTGDLRDGDKVTYRTLSGNLHAEIASDLITLDFPVLSGVPAMPHHALAALGVEIVACERNRDNYLVEVENYETLLACTPDFQRLADIDLEGVIVTTNVNTEEFDFASRYFGPGCGINEDPVTGSAHCFLAPYWAKRTGKHSFHAVQASKRRGILNVSIERNRVRIAGNAVITLQGQLQYSSLIKEKAA